MMELNAVRKAPSRFNKHSSCHLMISTTLTRESRLDLRRPCRRGGWYGGHEVPGPASRESKRTSLRLMQHVIVSIADTKVCMPIFDIYNSALFHCIEYKVYHSDNVRLYLCEITTIMNPLPVRGWQRHGEQRRK